MGRRAAARRRAARSAAALIYTARPRPDSWRVRARDASRNACGFQNPLWVAPPSPWGAERSKSVERGGPLTRREMLIRTGVLGASAFVLGVTPERAAAAPLDDALVEQVIEVLVRDTFAGLGVFAVPGPITDRYSLAQGQTSTRPGSVQAKGPELIAHTLDRYISLPDDYLQALVAAFRDGAPDTAGGLAALELLGQDVSTRPAGRAGQRRRGARVAAGGAAAELRGDAGAADLGHRAGPVVALRQPEVGREGAGAAAHRAGQPRPGGLDRRQRAAAAAGVGLGPAAVHRQRAADARGLRAVHRVPRLRPRDAARHAPADRLGPQHLHARVARRRRRLGRAARLLPRPRHPDSTRVLLRRTPTCAMSS